MSNKFGPSASGFSLVTTAATMAKGGRGSMSPAIKAPAPSAAAPQ